MTLAFVHFLFIVQGKKQFIFYLKAASFNAAVFIMCLSSWDLNIPKGFPFSFGDVSWNNFVI